MRIRIVGSALRRGAAALAVAYLAAAQAGAEEGAASAKTGWSAKSSPTPESADKPAAEP